MSAETFKLAQVELIKSRLPMVRKAKNILDKEQWKGILLGEIMMLHRIGLIGQHESMTLENLVADAATQYPYYNYHKLQGALKRDAEGRHNPGPLLAEICIAPGQL
jgi:hypothetical protein